jgi:hypothetical protein
MSGIVSQNVSVYQGPPFEFDVILYRVFRVFVAPVVAVMKRR